MRRLAILSLLLLTGCGEDDSPKDYLKIAGGGLTFNYRYSEATSVVVAKQMSPLPAGSIVEATFALPGGQGQERVERPAMCPGRTCMCLGARMGLRRTTSAGGRGGPQRWIASGRTRGSPASEGGAGASGFARDQHSSRTPPAAVDGRPRQA